MGRPEGRCRSAPHEGSPVSAFGPFLLPLPLIAVLRGITPEEIPDVAGVLVDAGFRILEVPLNSPRAFDSIRLLAARWGTECLVGAGTVIAVGDVALTRAVQELVVVHARPLPAAMAAGPPAG